MRFRYIDFSRAVLFCLGLVLHAAWLLKERSGALTGVHNFIHSFRMEAFFVIAGFFAAIMLSKYTPEEFLRRRLVRLTVPMIFCGLTFNTLLASAHREKWYDVSFLVTPNYWLDRDWMAHLWFLGTLIVYVLVAYGVHKAWPHIDRTLRQRRLSFPAFFGIVVITQYAVSQLGHVVPSTPWGTSWIIADKIDTFDYFTYFVVGYFLFHHQELLDDLVDRKFVNAACAASYWLAIAFLSDYRGGTHLIDILAGANSLAMCGLLFWLGRRYFNTDNPIVQSLSDMSYTVYLVHWPIMALLYRDLVRFRLPVDMAFATLVLVTGALSIAFHVYVVQRSDFMSFVMNGRRARDRQPASGSPRFLSTRLFPRL